MKELYQIRKEVIKLKQWKDVQEMMHITLRDYKEYNHEPIIPKESREDDFGQNLVVIHLPIHLGENFHIGQIVNLSILELNEDELLKMTKWVLLSDD